MKIAILSDFHFGFTYTSELENDSFENAEEAIEKALDCDLILIAGDVFDSRTPRTSVLAKSVNVLVKPLLQENKGVKLISSSKELKTISQRIFNHLPVIAIHGTHERSGKDLINPIQALENAGILIYLHCDTIVLEKDGKKVAIHGMSGVPERYAKEFLEKWNPRPVEGCFNILLLHQSIAPFIYSPLEPPSLSISDLPNGFDLIVDGHLHFSTKEKMDGTTLIFPGSTIVTQFEANEAYSEKGFFKVEIKEDGFKLDFVKLENSRKFFYEELKLSKDISTREQIENKIKGILRGEFKKKPLIKIKLVGKEFQVSDKELREIEKKYSEKAILLFSKDLESEEVSRKIEILRNLREQKLSIEEIGLNILEKSLGELGFSSSFDWERIFHLLSENDVETASNILLGEQTTLEKVLEKSLSKGLKEWVK